MKNKSKRIVSVLLALVMVLAALPLTAFARTSENFEYIVWSEEDKTCVITGYTGEATALEIPSNLDGYTVTHIGEWAFPDCTALKSVTFPDSVTHIGRSAFEGCTALESITFPDSVTHIEPWAFRGCTALANITIPDSVTGIGSDVFSGTAYYNNTGNWENDVLYIGNHLIEAKDTLSGTYTIKAGTKSVAEYAFDDCAALTSITIPNSMTRIGDSVFNSCTALESVTIPDSVTSIGWAAFENCEALESVTIPDSVTSIGENAFYGCTSLTSITIPDSVTSIGGSAFQNCDALKSITIPDSVTSIGGYAFQNCTALQSITIPDSVTRIGGYAFDNTAYYNNTSNWENDVLYIGKHLIEAKDTLSGAYTIKAGTKTIADSAFEDCTALTSVTIPDSVTSIGDGAFGYYYTPDYEYAKVDGFTIRGNAGTAAETYATENGFAFVDLQNPADENKPSADVNGDGKVNAVDARFVLQASSGARTLTEEQTKAADVNGDGKVNAVDARWILQIASGARTL